MIKIKKALLALGALALISLFAGCGTTTGLAPKTTRSGFDGAAVVTIQPHGAASQGLASVPLGLGAQWNSGTPDHVILVTQIYFDYLAISGAAFNIDGEKVDLLEPMGITDFEQDSTGVRTSKRGFAVPLDTVDKILASKKTWLRIQTPTGSLESAIIDGAKDSKAFHALKRFKASVDQERVKVESIVMQK